MDEANPQPLPLQIKHPRPIRVRIAIPANHMERPPQDAQCIENTFVRYIAQMPDLVSPGDFAWQMKWQTVVGIGKDGYAHRPI